MLAVAFTKTVAQLSMFSIFYMLVEKLVNKSSLLMWNELKLLATGRKYFLSIESVNHLKYIRNQNGLKNESLF